MPRWLLLNWVQCQPGDQASVLPKFFMAPDSKPILRILGQETQTISIWLFFFTHPKHNLTHPRLRDGWLGRAPKNSLLLRKLKFIYFFGPDEKCIELQNLHLLQNYKPDIDYSWFICQELPPPPPKYRKTSNISCTFVGNKIVDNSDVVGASPVGAAPTTSSFSTLHLASMDWAKTTARGYNKHLNFGIWCDLYQRFYCISQGVGGGGLQGGPVQPVVSLHTPHMGSPQEWGQQKVEMAILNHYVPKLDITPIWCFGNGASWILMGSMNIDGLEKKRCNSFANYMQFGVQHLLHWNDGPLN